MLNIISPSRLHLSLIDLNAELGRVDGGVGITLDRPHIRVSAEEADVVEVSGHSHLADRIRKAAEAVLPSGKGIRIHVEEDMPSHVGLGSGTQAALCTAACANELYDLGLDARQMGIAVGRGGTSGIGVAAFESGGFLVDCGHRFADKGSFSPSSASRADPAPILFRHDLPDWCIVLALPEGEGAHDAREVDVFKQQCPIPLREVQEVSHVILMQMMPAIIEGDIDGFGRAVDHLQRVGFKQREVALQLEEVRDVIGSMRDAGCAGAGMSSFGPAVYGLVEGEAQGKRIQRDVQGLLDDTTGGSVILTHANNSGARIWKD